MRAWTAAALLCSACLARAGTAAAAWSDLWRTPDQQGQALLDAGKPAQAAGRFQDPRRRAYADLAAGRCQEAAKLLAPFTDAESEYNRGNALARSGQLQAALAAYDAALQQAPVDKDIRHNRDLVERALRRQHQSPQSSAGNGRQGGRQTGSAGQQPQQSKGGQQGRASPQSGDNSRQAGARGSQSAAGGQLASNDASRADAGNRRSKNAGASKETPAQAQHDAAAAVALAHRQQQRGGRDETGRTPGSTRSGTPESAPKDVGKEPDTSSRLAGGAQTPRRKPETERQLALDQWLRQIPDSPAGLLQRKFLIEHMMRQQQSGEQAGDGP